MFVIEATQNAVQNAARVVAADTAALNVNNGAAALVVQQRQKHTEPSTNATATAIKPMRKKSPSVQRSKN
jgi:hypothetical protein